MAYRRTRTYSLPILLAVVASCSVQRPCKSSTFDPGKAASDGKNLLVN